MPDAGREAPPAAWRATLRRLRPAMPSGNAGAAAARGRQQLAAIGALLEAAILRGHRIDQGGGGGLGGGGRVAGRRPRTSLAAHYVRGGSRARATARDGHPRPRARTLTPAPAGGCRSPPIRRGSHSPAHVLPRNERRRLAVAAAASGGPRTNMVGGRGRPTYRPPRRGLTALGPARRRSPHATLPPAPSRRSRQGLPHVRRRPHTAAGGRAVRSRPRAGSGRARRPPGAPSRRRRTPSVPRVGCPRCHRRSPDSVGPQTLFFGACGTVTSRGGTSQARRAGARSSVTRAGRGGLMTQSAREEGGWGGGGAPPPLPTPPRGRAAAGGGGGGGGGGAPPRLSNVPRGSVADGNAAEATPT